MEKEGELHKRHMTAVHCFVAYRNTVLNGTYCNSTYDGLLCWPPTKAGQITSQKCPPYYGFTSTNYAYRKCGDFGEWVDVNSTLITLQKTNFEFCLDDSDDAFQNDFIEFTDDMKTKVEIMNIVGISFLLLSILSVMTVMFLYHYVLPKFVISILHVRIYKHVYCCVLLDAICKLSTHLIVFLQIQHILHTHHLSDIVCNVLTSLNHYSDILLLCWFSLDSHFLQITSRSGYLCTSGYLTYWIIGWGVPLIPVTVWIVAISLSHKVVCWKNHSVLRIVWIVETPKLIFIMFTAFYLTLSLWRVHQQEFRKRIFDVKKVKTEISMSFILFIFITCSYIFILIPTHLHSDALHILQHIGLVLVSSRGMFTSMMFAFLNKNFLDYLRHNDARLPCKRYLRMI